MKMGRESQIRVRSVIFLKTALNVFRTFDHMERHNMNILHIRIDPNYIRQDQRNYFLSI